MQQWPNEFVLARHVQSDYNVFNPYDIPGYVRFAELFDREFEVLTKENIQHFPSPELRKMAEKMVPYVMSDVSDYDTEVTEVGYKHAVLIGEALPGVIQKPDAVYVSPYKRARQTHQGFIEGWPALGDVPTKFEDRSREQEHGMRGMYRDYRVYCALNPDYALLYKHVTQYEYRNEAGESPLDLTNRMRSMVASIVRKHGGTPRVLEDMLVEFMERHGWDTRLKIAKALGLDAVNKPENVLCIQHHLGILAMRKVLENWDRERYLKENEPENRPPNGSISIYRGVSGKHTGRIISDPREINMVLAELPKAA
jgi:broad specificity phosphatase PhoE